MRKYLRPTEKLIIEYLAAYTGHPSNVKNIRDNVLLRDGHQDAERFYRDKKGILHCCSPWLLTDFFRL